MKRQDFIVDMLESAEKANSDSSEVSYDLKQEISASGFDSAAWSQLLNRFAHSPSAAVSAALAWALVDDAEGQLQVDLGSVLRFAEALETFDHPGLAGGVLTAVAERLPGIGSEFGHSDSERLRNLLLRCFGTGETGRFQVEICVLDVLERLNAAGALVQVFGDQGIAEVGTWLRSFAAREVDGPYAEDARSLLAGLSGAGEVAG
jgi:hypothetical protein